MPKKKIETETPEPSVLAEVFADFPNIETLERRLLDPSGPASLPIRLIDEPNTDIDPTGAKRKWYLRWVNTAMPGRFHTMASSMGYVAVKWDELANKEQIADRFEGVGPGIDNNVRRGDQGKDLLMKIPYAYYLRIKRRQQELTEKRNSPKSITDQLQQEAAMRIGDEAAVGIGRVGAIREISPDEFRSDG